MVNALELLKEKDLFLLFFSLSLLQHKLEYKVHLSEVFRQQCLFPAEGKGM